MRTEDRDPWFERRQFQSNYGDIARDMEAAMKLARTDTEQGHREADSAIRALVYLLAGQIDYIPDGGSRDDVRLDALLRYWERAQQGGVGDEAEEEWE